MDVEQSHCLVPERPLLALTPQAFVGRTDLILSQLHLIKTHFTLMECSGVTCKYQWCHVAFGLYSVGNAMNETCSSVQDLHRKRLSECKNRYSSFKIQKSCTHQCFRGRSKSCIQHTSNTRQTPCLLSIKPGYGLTSSTMDMKEEVKMR